MPVRIRGGGRVAVNARPGVRTPGTSVPWRYCIHVLRTSVHDSGSSEDSTGGKKNTHRRHQQWPVRLVPDVCVIRRVHLSSFARQGQKSTGKAIFLQRVATPRYARSSSSSCYYYRSFTFSVTESYDKRDRRVRPNRKPATVLRLCVGEGGGSTGYGGRTTVKRSYRAWWNGMDEKNGSSETVDRKDKTILRVALRKGIRMFRIDYIYQRCIYGGGLRGFQPPKISEKCLKPRLDVNIYRRI